MNITLRQMQLFLALARLKSITAVAQSFHVTQPTVSMQLKELSEHVGMPLYEVIGKRLHLTQAGLQFEKTARTVLDELEDFRQNIFELKGLKKGRLRLSVVSTAEYFIPRILGQFCERYPDVDIELEVLNRDGVVKRLENNQDDLCIMSKPPQHLDVESKAFLTNSLHLVAWQGHPWARKRKIGLAELAKQPLILRELGSGTRLACDSHFKAHQVEPAVRMQLGSNEAIKQAVKSGLGMAIISEHAFGKDPAAHGLAVLKAETFPIHANWYLVRLNGKRLSPMAAVFWNYLQSLGGRIYQ